MFIDKLCLTGKQRERKKNLRWKCVHAHAYCTVSLQVTSRPPISCVHSVQTALLTHLSPPQDVDHCQGLSLLFISKQTADKTALGLSLLLSASQHVRNSAFTTHTHLPKLTHFTGLHVKAKSSDITMISNCFYAVQWNFKFCIRHMQGHEVILLVLKVASDKTGLKSALEIPTATTISA